MYKIIVAGSRDFDDYKLLENELNSFLYNRVDDHIVIVSGTARGADKLGERYAKDHMLDIQAYPADWKRYGKSAGYRRNEEMAQNADGCIVFWKNKSRGTMHMINLAKKYNLELKIVNV